MLTKHAAIALAIFLTMQAPEQSIAESQPDIHSDSSRTDLTAPLPVCSLQVRFPPVAEALGLHATSTPVENELAYQNDTSASPSPSIDDVIRFEMHNASLYGLFKQNDDTVSRAESGVVGIGLERPIDRGLALNFELLQNTPRSKSAPTLLENTKAALKLRLKF